MRGDIASLLALSLYAVSPLVRLLTQTITTFVRLEVQMVSVERVRDYLLVSPQNTHGKEALGALCVSASLHDLLQHTRRVSLSVFLVSCGDFAGLSRGCPLRVLCLRLCSVQIPPEDTTYDAITGLRWHHPTGQTEKGGPSKKPFSLWCWLSWRQQKQKDLLPLHATEEERQPLLSQQPSLSRCPDCAAPKGLSLRQPFVRHPALPPTVWGFRYSTAAAAGAIAGHETLASLRPGAPNVLCGGVGGGPGEKEAGDAKTPLPFAPSVPFGFGTRGRIDFENVTVAYRWAAP